jgi:hypothetical protein
VAIQSREPGLITNDALLTDFTSAKFGRDELNAAFSATIETLFIAGENIDRFLGLGRNFGLAWHDALAVTADLNFDTLLDAQDWQLFVSASETDLSGLTEIEQYAHGDLNGDGQNDIVDFGIFKQQYLGLHGAAAFASLLQNVPEGSSSATAFVGLIASVVGLPRLGRRKQTSDRHLNSTEG